MIDIEFLSWPGILAIATLLISFGKFTDWILRKRQKENIIKWLGYD